LFLSLIFALDKLQRVKIKNSNPHAVHSVVD